MWRLVVDEDGIRGRYPFAALVRPRVGLLTGVSFLPLELGAVELEVAATRLGNLTRVLPHVSTAHGTDVRDVAMGGGGADTDAEQSWVRAVVEAAERYSTMVYDESEFIVASALELGAAAIDLTRIPRCSPEEYAAAGCPLRPAPLDEPIRWVRGVSLHDGAERLVPAVMAHLHLKPWSAERFWFPISTGVAAHTRLEAALLAALCENVERDALAISWLLRRRLPRIEPPPEPSAALSVLLDRVARSGVRHHAFDATTDCGVPTVLAVQEAPGHPHCEVLVSCATSPDPETAYGKAIREVSPARAILHGAPPVPADVRDFSEITHGASYYGHGGHRDEFAFLLDSPHETTIAAMAARAPVPSGAAESAQLTGVLDRLSELGMEAVAVDLTADEVRDAGLWVVRVVVPQLVPISFVHRARFLGTPRLRDQVSPFPDDRADQELFNTAPLPFA